jgi:hypothetical protein
VYCNVLVEELVGLILLDLSGQAYKRVGAMVHNADIGRGIIGVMDVTDIMVIFSFINLANCSECHTPIIEIILF